MIVHVLCGHILWKINLEFFRTFVNFFCSLDNGIKYVNQEFSKFFDIVHELTCINTTTKRSTIKEEVARVLHSYMFVPKTYRGKLC